MLSDLINRSVLSLELALQVIEYLVLDSSIFRCLVIHRNTQQVKVTRVKDAYILLVYVVMLYVNVNREISITI